MLQTMTFHRYMWIALSIQITFLAIISCNNVALSDFSIIDLRIVLVLSIPNTYPPILFPSGRICRR